MPDFGFYELVLILWTLVTFIEFGSRKFAHRVKTFWIILLGVYSFIVVISLMWSQEESYNATNIRDLFYHIFIPFLFAFISTYFISSDFYRKNLIQHATIGCVIISIFSIVTFIMNYGTNIDSMRSSAAFGNPNALAVFLVLNIPLLLYGIQKKIINKNFLYFALICLLMGVVCTISRKGLITAGISFLVFFFFARNYKILLFGFFFCIPLSIALISQQEQIAERFTQERVDKEFTGKWNMTLAGWDMFLDRPIHGWGYKGYYHKFGQYFKDSGRKKYDAHNNFITALANYGLLGFLPFLGIFLWPLGKALKAMKRMNKKSQNADRLRYAAGTAVLLPFIASAWFAGDLMYIPAITTELYVLTGMFCIPDRPDKQMQV